MIKNRKLKRNFYQMLKQYQKKGYTYWTKDPTSVDGATVKQWIKSFLFIFYSPHSLSLSFYFEPYKQFYFFVAFP